jgi:hypothetical protein
MPTYTCALKTTFAGEITDLSVPFTTSFSYFENGDNANPSRTYGKYFGSSGQLYGFWAAAIAFPSSGSGKNYSPPAYTSAQGFPAFNTSAIPPAETITSVSLSSLAYNYGPSTTTAQLHGLGTTTFDAGGVTASNWKSPSAFNNLCFTITGSRTGASVTSTGTSAAKSYINKGGITYFVLGDTAFINRNGYVSDDSGTIIPNQATTTLTVITSPEFVHASDISATPTITTTTTGGLLTNFYTFNTNNTLGQRPNGNVVFNSLDSTPRYTGPASYTGMAFNAGGKSSDSNTYYQNFYSFDCSSIPTGWTVTGAVLSTIIYGLRSNLGGNVAVPISFRKFDYGLNVEAADYRTSAQLAALPEYGSLSFPGGYSYSTDYRKITNTGTTLANDVSARGFINMVVVTNEQFGGSAPGGVGDSYYQISQPILFVTLTQTPSTTARTADTVTLALSPAVVSGGLKTSITGSAFNVTPAITAATPLRTAYALASSIDATPSVAGSGLRTAFGSATLSFPVVTGVDGFPTRFGSATVGVSLSTDSSSAALHPASSSTTISPSTGSTGSRQTFADTSLSVSPVVPNDTVKIGATTTPVSLSPEALAEAVRNALAQTALSLTPGTAADSTKTGIQNAAALLTVAPIITTDAYRNLSVGAATVTVSPVTASTGIRIVLADASVSVSSSTTSAAGRNAIVGGSLTVGVGTSSSSKQIQTASASAVIVTATGANGSQVMYPALFVWNGTGWVRGKLQVWTGSAWINAVPKYWDGTQWISSR